MKTRAADRPPTPRRQAGALTDLLHGGRPGLVEVVAATRSADGRLVDFRRGNFVRAVRREEFLETLGRLGRSERVVRMMRGGRA